MKKGRNLKAMQTEQNEKGRLRIRVLREDRNTPVENALIRISYKGEPDKVIEEVRTDNSGRSPELELSAPPLAYSMEPVEYQPYSEYNVYVEASDFEPANISGVEILPQTDSVQPVRLRAIRGPEDFERIVIPDHTLYGEYPPKIPEDEIKPMQETGEIVLSRVVIPEYVVVHDGSVNDDTATDYYVRYRDYIKNVACSEIYATWPEETIKANVLAIMSFTLNRVYTEWYRNKGFDFTITSSTAYDHKWMRGRNIFDSIDRVVDELFSHYLSRPNVRQPILTQYCDGERVTCPNWMT